MLMADGSWAAFRQAEDSRSIFSFLQGRVDSCDAEAVRQVLRE